MIIKRCRSTLLYIDCDYLKFASGGVDGPSNHIHNHIQKQTTCKEAD